jgi:hypothetical protein
MGYIMEHFNNNELLETLFYNIMMNLEHDALVAPENNVMSQSLYDNNPIKMVISDEEKNKLLPIKYKDALQKEQNTACFITQDDFNDEDDIIQLPCNHCFTPDSIMQWLTEECAECPVCRYKFESVEKRIISDVDHNLNNSDHDSDDDSDLPDLIEINHPNLQNYPQFNNNIFLNNFINNFVNNITYHDNNYINTININNFIEINEHEDEAVDDINDEVD